jgi:hypothetical protein
LRGEIQSRAVPPPPLVEEEGFVTRACSVCGDLIDRVRFFFCVTLCTSECVKI